ncbi:membrane protein insertion efficiency factor YidD [Verrucomicrobiota bacterium]
MCTSLATAQIQLATDLFEESDFESCISECKRVLAVSPSNHTARLLHSVANLRLEKQIDNSISELKSLIIPDTPIEIRTKAAYECARAEWERGHYQTAFELFQIAFHNTSNKGIFLKSACSLFLLFEKKPELKKKNTDLVMQINSSRTLWYGKLFSECRINNKKKKTALTGKPGEWGIWFYRKQISPALGQRCSLHPSCSEYGRQALRKHGILGLAFIADRGVREPAVTAKRKAPIRIGEHWRYQDTVEEHDWWMKR